VAQDILAPTLQPPSHRGLFSNARRKPRAGRLRGGYPAGGPPRSSRHRLLWPQATLAVLFTGPMVCPTYIAGRGRAITWVPTGRRGAVGWPTKKRFVAKCWGRGAEPSERTGIAARDQCSDAESRHCEGDGTQRLDGSHHRHLLVCEERGSPLDDPGAYEAQARSDVLASTKTLIQRAAIARAGLLTKARPRPEANRPDCSKRA